MAEIEYPWKCVASPTTNSSKFQMEDPCNCVDAPRTNLPIVQMDDAGEYQCELGVPGQDTNSLKHFVSIRGRLHK